MVKKHLVLTGLWLLFVSSVAIAQSSSEHYGFTFLSSPDQCEKIMMKRYGVSSTLTTVEEPFTRVGIPGFLFSAPFEGHNASNTLSFTPHSKKLYEISHVVTVGSKDDCLRTYAFFVQALNNKYGVTKPNKSNAETEANFISQTWKSKGIEISLVALYNFSDAPNAVTITYTNKAAEIIKKKEQAVISGHINKDI